LLLIVLWIVEAILPKDSLPSWIKNPHRLLVNILTNDLGDMWVYMRRPWDAARIRVRFEERFGQAIEILDAELKAKETRIAAAAAEAAKQAASSPEVVLAAQERAAPPDVQCLFVIAHSMGSVVAFEALTGRRMIQQIQDRLFAQGKPLHFFSIGSALNDAWDMVGTSERFRFTVTCIPPCAG
jgi:hypothetical protein